MLNWFSIQSRASQRADSWTLKQVQGDGLCPRAAGLASRSRAAAKAGGASRDRTDDLKLAKLALSQLSYGPVRGQASK